MHAVAPPPKDPLTEPGPWNAIAPGYDQACFARLPALYERALELLSPQSGDRVLDVASGPGTFSVRVAPRVGHVMAIDFAEGMIERLRAHIMRGKLANLEGRVMDGQELAFEEASFDAASSLFGVSAFARPGQGLAEMLRVVVPGGRVLVGSWAAPDRNTLTGAALAALGAVLPDWSPPPASGFERSEACERALERAGFELVTSESFEQSLRYGSVAEYWQAFELSSPEAFLLRSELGSDAYTGVAARARAALGAEWGESALELRGSAILTLGECPLSAA